MGFIRINIWSWRREKRHRWLTCNDGLFTRGPRCPLPAKARYYPQELCGHDGRLVEGRRNHELVGRATPIIAGRISLDSTRIHCYLMRLLLIYPSFVYFNIPGTAILCFTGSCSKVGNRGGYVKSDSFFVHSGVQLRPPTYRSISMCHILICI